MSKSRVENLSSETIDSKKEYKLLRKGLAVALAGAFALGAAGCSGDKVGAQAPEVKPSTTTESVAEQPAETIVEPTEQYADAMEVYKEMSVEEFEALPREERLSYAQYLIDQIERRGIYDNAYEKNNSESAYIAPVLNSINNSGQEIINNNIYVNQIAYLQFIESDKDRKEFDQLDGQKLLSYAYYNVNGDGASVSDRYLSSKEQMSTLEYPAPLQKEVRIVEGDCELRSGLDSINGSTVQFKDVIYKTSDGETRLARFVYCEFDNYDGLSKSAWLLETLASSEIDLEANSSIETVK